MPGRHSYEGLEERIVAELGRRGLVTRESRARRRAPAAMMAAALLAVAALLSVSLMPDSRASAAPANYMIALYTTDHYVPEAPGSQPSRSREYAEWARTHSTREHAVVGGGELTKKVGAMGRPIGSDGELAGYFLVRANSREAAVALAQSSPHLRYGGTIAVYEIGG